MNFPKSVRKAACRLVERGLVDFIGESLTVEINATQNKRITSKRFIGGSETTPNEYLGLRQHPNDCWHEHTTIYREGRIVRDGKSSGVRESRAKKHAINGQDTLREGLDFGPPGSAERLEKLAEFYANEQNEISDISPFAVDMLEYWVALADTLGLGDNPPANLAQPSLSGNYAKRIRPQHLAKE